MTRWKHYLGASKMIYISKKIIMCIMQKIIKYILPLWTKIVSNLNSAMRVNFPSVLTLNYFKIIRATFTFVHDPSIIIGITSKSHSLDFFRKEIKTSCKCSTFKSKTVLLHTFFQIFFLLSTLSLKIPTLN